MLKVLMLHCSQMTSIANTSQMVENSLRILSSVGIYGRTMVSVMLQHQHPVVALTISSQNNWLLYLLEKYK